MYETIVVYEENRKKEAQIETNDGHTRIIHRPTDGLDFRWLLRKSHVKIAGVHVVFQ